MTIFYKAAYTYAIQSHLFLHLTNWLGLMTGKITWRVPLFMWHFKIEVHRK